MRPYFLFLLSWLFPGLGHAVQKRYLKCFVFLTGNILLLALGVIMHGRFYEFAIHPLLLLGFLGDLGNGVFYFLLQSLGWSTGNIASLTHHYGTTYMATAGLLNYLVALNAFDIAKGRKN
jgi:hypothetical protein